MKLLRSIVNLFRDSPTFGRDRAGLFTGFTIGTASLILNGVILMLVTPLMLDPNDSDFRPFTQNLEFGQLLALILLGGAAAFATFVIPLRLIGVFWGPRIGGYFDQIVLSGISPLRFVIGKVLSQSMFFALIMCLLVPWLVLSVAIGGMEPLFCLGGLFLVWLYCVTLTLVTLLLSLYVNELIAALMVIISAAWLAALGCIPLSFQPFVMTPFPVLTSPVYRALPDMQGTVALYILPQFIACAVCMGLLCCLTMLAIHLGPLFGIVRENSTFGEVVRAGDSKRKRRFRLRLHIQRPSEIAFFYENRGANFRRYEGLLRWGIGLAGLSLFSIAATAVLLIFARNAMAGIGSFFAYGFHAVDLVIHGSGLLMAALLFSHAKNTTYLRIAFCFGRKLEVAKLDTVCFLLFALFSTSKAIATPFLFEGWFAAPNGLTLFPDLQFERVGQMADFRRLAVQGPLVLSLAGLVIYALQRFGCQNAWMKTASLLGTFMAYYLTMGVMPFTFAILVEETPELRQNALFAASSQHIGAVSPIYPLMKMFGERFRIDTLSTMRTLTTFYVSHVVLLGIVLTLIRRKGRKVRDEYLADPKQEVA